MELMIAISLIGIVVGMLYLYNNRGWLLFDKGIAYGKLQTDARSILEQMTENLKRSSYDLIYTSTVYNSNVPFPEDFIYGKPYIYFAVPQKQKYKARDIKSKDSTVDVPNYDYYLYYIAKVKDRYGGITQDKAKLKLFLIRDVDGKYTINNADKWPILPPKLDGVADYTNVNGIKQYGQASNIEYQDSEYEFSLYQSEFSYNYYNTNYDKLFKIRVKLIDTDSKAELDYETAVTPRN